MKKEGVFTKHKDIYSCPLYHLSVFLQIVHYVTWFEAWKLALVPNDTNSWVKFNLAKLTYKGRVSKRSYIYIHTHDQAHILIMRDFRTVRPSPSLSLFISFPILHVHSTIPKTKPILHVQTNTPLKIHFFKIMPATLKPHPRRVARRAQMTQNNFTPTISTQKRTG